MALKIRLSRAGAKKRPFYHIVVADSRSPRDGRFIDRLGYYDPMKPKDSAERVKLNTERAKAWLDKGAQPTDRVARFLTQAELMTRPERHNPIKAKPKAKAQERLKAAQEAAEAAKTAVEEAPVEAAPVEEAPAEEAPAEEAPVEEPAAEAPVGEDAPAEQAAAEVAPEEGAAEAAEKS